MTLVPLPLLALLLAGAPDVPAPAPSPWWAVEPAGSGPGWQVEASARAVLGTGRTAYALYDNLGFLKVSNLDFHGLAGAGLEVRIRAANRARLWATATLGLDARSAGTLQDEDFPVPGLLADYSSTDSALHGGGAWHLAAAAGYDVHQGAATRLAFFAGGRHAEETLHAFGCVQTAGNPQICAGPGIAPSVRVITARTRWTAPMVGVDGALRLSPEVTLSASAACLPFLSVSGSDTHWLRTGPQAPGIDFSGPTPLTASDGLGVELEAALRWRTGLGPILGLGGRFTRLEARRGLMHFDQSVYPTPSGPAVAQVISLVTERRQLWLEAAWRY